MSAPAPAKPTDKARKNAMVAAAVVLILAAAVAYNSYKSDGKREAREESFAAQRAELARTDAVYNDPGDGHVTEVAMYIQREIPSGAEYIPASWGKVVRFRDVEPNWYSVRHQYTVRIAGERSRDFDQLFSLDARGKVTDVEKFIDHRGEE